MIYLLIHVPNSLPKPDISCKTKKIFVIVHFRNYRTRVMHAGEVTLELKHDQIYDGNGMQDEIVLGAIKNHLAELTSKVKILVVPHSLDPKPPGSRGLLPAPSPLRTVRDSFPSYGSSLSKGNP